MGVGQVPIDSMRQAGVRLCLGTDSLASVPTLDLLDDMRELRRVGLDPWVIVEMATRGGAMALGLSDLGTLEVGKTAAMAFAAAVGEPAEPFEFLFDDETRLRTVAV